MRTSQFRQPSGSDEETGRDHAHPQPLGLWGISRSDGQPPAPRLRSAGPAPFLAEQYASYPASQEKQKFGIQGVGLMDFLYQPDREIIALAHPDLALTGLGGTPVARAAGIPAMNAV